MQAPEKDKEDDKDSPPTNPSETRRGELPIREHIAMVNDLPRGQKYLEAMKAKIRPGDVVLEVGTGAGLLSCMAARLGAKHVYTVERSAQLFEVAKRVMAANGLSDKVTVINAHSKDLVSMGVVPEPVDVFVTETIGTQGLDEGILPIFDHVRPLLSRKVRVIPESVTFKHCLVNMSGIREHVEILRPLFGFDLSALNDEVKSNNLYWMQPIDQWREVSNTAETSHYGLLNFVSSRSEQKLEITDDNVCDGMLVWAEFKLAKHLTIDTRHREFGQSWANSIHFMKRLIVVRGQICTSEFTIREDRNGWTMNWNIGPRPEAPNSPAQSPTG